MMLMVRETRGNKTSCSCRDFNAESARRQYDSTKRCSPMAQSPHRGIVSVQQQRSETVTNDIKEELFNMKALTITPIRSLRFPTRLTPEPTPGRGGADKPVLGGVSDRHGPHQLRYYLQNPGFLKAGSVSEKMPRSTIIPGTVQPRHMARVQ